ncbi:hypothetical protein AC1031_004232 [Aphanomyces cochlioides]|nr:hypothetical protein AC1031_004232 [Aphanomyces cochlioides]
MATYASNSKFDYNYMDLSTEMINWLCVNRCDFDPAVYLKRAVAQSRIEVMELFIDRFGIPWSDELTGEAVQNGQSKSLRWIYDKNPAIIQTIDENVLEDPVAKGNLPLVEWLCDVAGLKFSIDLPRHCCFQAPYKSALLVG